MSGSYFIGTQGKCCLEKNIKLNLTVTQNIGSRCKSILIFGKHIIDDPLFVQIIHINHLKRYSQFLGYHQRIIAVLHPGTFVFQRYRGIIPVAHKEGDDLMTLLLKQISSNRRINPAGKPYYNLHLKNNLCKITEL